MNSRVKKLIEELLTLSVTERAEIITALQKSLDAKCDHHIDEFWKKEVEARIDEYDAGAAEAYSVDEVMRMLKSE